MQGLTGEVKKLQEENKTLTENYNSERILRKKYYNMVEDMKGKIRVYCRSRPLSRSELERVGILTMLDIAKIPSSTILYHGVPYRTVPHHTTPHHITPHHATPHHITPRHTPPHHTTPHHNSLHHTTTPHPTTPHHAIPHHITPRHTTTHYTTPHHTKHTILCQLNILSIPGQSFCHKISR